MSDETAARRPTQDSHAELARRADLVYRDDSRPGIRRRAAGRGFTYLGPRGRRIDGPERQRIEALAIPPAWTDVWISPDSHSHLLATGHDDLGRKQYIYHPAWTEVASTDKFSRVAEFGNALPDLRQHVARELRRPVSESWVCAAVVRLIDDSLVRPGGLRKHRGSARTPAVGATTLRGKHVRVDGTVVRLSFPGKSNVEQSLEVRDPLLARRLSDLLDGTSTRDLLFVDGDGHAVTAARLNAYIAAHAGDGFTAKDLRTWGATSLVAGALAVETTADREADQDGQIRSAIEHAAERLGNTPTVCRASYVAPAVIDAFRTGDLEQKWRRSRRTTWLSREEQTVRRVLTG